MKSPCFKRVYEMLLKGTSEKEIKDIGPPTTIDEVSQYHLEARVDRVLVFGALVAQREDHQHLV
jgi:hypothetical protein